MWGSVSHQWLLPLRAFQSLRKKKLEAGIFDLRTMVFQKVKAHMFRAQAFWDPNVGSRFFRAMEKKNFKEPSSASTYLDYLLAGATFGQTRPSRTAVPPFCEGEASPCLTPSHVFHSLTGNCTPVAEDGGNCALVAKDGGRSMSETPVETGRDNEYLSG